MTNEERRKWLAGLKVGDEVAVVVQKRARAIETINSFASVYPGFVQVTAGNRYFRAETGKSPYDSSRYCESIHPVSDDRRVQVAQYELLRYIEWTLVPSIEDMDIETVRRILAALKEAKGKSE